jgi:hypothetical protein
LVASIRTLPRNFSGPAILMALSFATPSVARTTASPKDAASPKVPPDAHLLCPRERLIVAGVARAHLHGVTERDEPSAQRLSNISRSENSDVDACAPYRSLSSTRI